MKRPLQKDSFGPLHRQTKAGLLKYVKYSAVLAYGFPRTGHKIATFEVVSSLIYDIKLANMQVLSESGNVGLFHLQIVCQLKLYADFPYEKESTDHFFPSQKET